MGCLWGSAFYKVRPSFPLPYQASTGYQYVDEPRMPPALGSLRVFFFVFVFFFTVLMNLLGSEPRHLLLREGWWWRGLLFIKLKLCLLGAQRERNMASYVGYPPYPSTAPVLPTPCPRPIPLLLHPTAHCVYSPVPRMCYSEPCLSAGNDQDGGVESRGRDTNG